MNKRYDLKDRYYLFEIVAHYPSGGLGDIVATADTMDGILDEALELSFENWVEVFDKDGGISIDLGNDLSIAGFYKDIDEFKEEIKKAIKTKVYDNINYRKLYNK